MIQVGNIIQNKELAVNLILKEQQYDSVFEYVQ
jgi:hypothetical protein